MVTERDSAFRVVWNAIVDVLPKCGLEPTILVRDYASDASEESLSYEFFELVQAHIWDLSSTKEISTKESSDARAMWDKLFNSGMVLVKRDDKNQLKGHFVADAGTIGSLLRNK